MKTAVQLLMESTMGARTIAIVMTRTQSLVTDAVVMKVIKEILIIPMAAQVDFLI